MRYVFHHVTVHYKYLVFMNLDGNVLIDVQVRHPKVLVTAGINLSICSKAAIFFFPPGFCSFPIKCELLVAVW